jgi:hypothetical protein
MTDQVNCGGAPVKSHVKLGLMALGAGLAFPAQASDKQDFVSCDGRVHPGKQEDGMRWQAPTSGYGGIAAFRGDVVEACTRALASERLLPTQALRRASLLRARAAAHLQAGNAGMALADLDLAGSATADLASDPFYKRSMGVSFSLMRALALVQSDNLAAAVPLARQAMAARPYALQVQQLGAEILQVARPKGVASPSPWSALVRLEPEAVTSAFLRESESGNFAAALALRPSVTLTWPKAPLQSFALMARSAEASQFLNAVIVQLDAAYARAATGDPAGARREIADLKVQVAATRPTLPSGPAAPVVASTLDALDNFIATRTRQIEARIAVADGHAATAVAALVASPMPNDAATVELLTAMKANLPAKDAALVPETSSFRQNAEKQSRERLANLVPMALIAPETPRAVVDYARARPNILGALIGGALSMGTSLLGGIDRTDGFRSTRNADGTLKVEFIGNTPSAPMVQEMTLLRAAELTKASGQPAFVIVDRKDFSRVMRTTQSGIEISSVPAGFKTELTIRYVTAGEQPEHALDATAIIDALGPLYYEEGKGKG